MLDHQVLGDGYFAAERSVSAFFLFLHGMKICEEVDYQV